MRNKLPCFTDEARGANRHLVTLTGQVAQRKQASPAQVALAWILAQKPWIGPIPGTTRLHLLEENIGAATLNLNADDLAELSMGRSIYRKVSRTSGVNQRCLSWLTRPCILSRQVFDLHAPITPQRHHQ